MKGLGFAWTAHRDRCCLLFSTESRRDNLSYTRALVSGRIFAFTILLVIPGCAHKAPGPLSSRRTVQHPKHHRILYPAKWLGRWGLIDRAGRIVVKPRWNRVSTDQDDWMLYHHFKASCDHGPLDYWSRFQPYSAARRRLTIRFFIDGAGIVFRSTKAGYVSESGRMLIRPRFDAARPFSEGLAVVGKARKKQGSHWQRLVFGVINRKGFLVVPFRYAAITAFNGGRATAWIREFGGLRAVQLNKSGRVVTRWTKGEPGLKLFRQQCEFRNGNYAYMAPTKTSSKLGQRPLAGIRSAAGRTLVTPRFMRVWRPSGNLAPVYCTNLRWGVIDAFGRLIVPCRYSSVGRYRLRRAAVCVNSDNNGESVERCGHIDTNGRVTTPLKYTSVGSFYEGLAQVCLEDQCGFVSLDGKIAIQPSKRKFASFKNGIAPYRDVGSGHTGTAGAIDRRGRRLFSGRYQQINYPDRGLIRADRHCRTRDGQGFAICATDFYDLRGHLVWRSPRPYLASPEHRSR